MKKLLLVSALLASTAAYAEPQNIKIRDVFVERTVQVPKVVKGCKWVDVPVYETYQRKGSAAEAITGGVIGGAIGNQFGNGSGKDVMTILGVIIGANAADRKEQRITGYTQEQRCSEDILYYDEKVKTYSHSVMTFDENGVNYEVEFVK